MDKNTKKQAELLNLKSYTTSKDMKNIEIFDLKEHGKMMKKIVKDTMIMDTRSSSWNKNLFTKINKYDEIRIVNKITIFMNELILVQKDYHEFLLKAKSTNTNKGLIDLVNELRSLKERKNHLYVKCKSISHIQGLIDLRSVKN
jgi:hypothetical protein